MLYTSLFVESTKLNDISKAYEYITKACEHGEEMLAHPPNHENISFIKFTLEGAYIRKARHIYASYENIDEKLTHEMETALRSAYKLNDATHSEIQAWRDFLFAWLMINTDRKKEASPSLTHLKTYLQKNTNSQLNPLYQSLIKEN